MKLYHGSLEKIEIPQIRLSNRTLDYGVGFYHHFGRTGRVMGKAQNP